MKMVIAVVVVIFAFGFVSAAGAIERNAYSIDYSVKGKVVSFDLLKQTLTIMPTTIVPLTSDGEFTFKINEMTNVRMCDQVKTLEDIQVGEVVTIQYSMEGSRLYADTINVPTPLIACLLEKK